VTGSDLLERARTAFAGRQWAEAFSALSNVDRERGLDAEDVERLATAAYLVGKEVESEAAWARAHQERLQAGEPAGAASCALRLAFLLMERGESAPASGWIARASRILDEVEGCVEQGYLLLPSAVRHVYEGDYARAFDTFVAAAELGERFADPELVAFARHGQGRALLRMGRREEGVALLDEAMAAVEAGEVGPIFAGDIYCSVIEACHESFDVRRAAEWTSALTRWCEAQPDLVPYRGQCLIRRAEILRLRGQWEDAASEASRAREWLLNPPPKRAVGAAYYQLGELHRVRGEQRAAEVAYREASRWGRRPEPGMALLRLEQGEVKAAASTIRVALDQAREPRDRCALLPAAVEIAVANSDLETARLASEELAEMAKEFDTPLLHAHASRSTGAVLMAGGDAMASLPLLHRSVALWEELGAPYESARARALCGLASRALEDHTTAELELEAARATFQRLGATPDLAWLARLTRSEDPMRGRRLTARELEVLRLVAAGHTNRAIAAQLHLSERTVERHVSNIFAKLGLASRSAATAYAYEHQLV